MVKVTKAFEVTLQKVTAEAVPGFLGHGQTDGHITAAEEKVSFAPALSTKVGILQRLFAALEQNRRFRVLPDQVRGGGIGRPGGPGGHPAPSRWGLRRHGEQQEGQEPGEESVPEDKSPPG